MNIKNTKPKEMDVLVVDDEKVFCMIMEKRLSALGYSCRTATSAEDALEYLKKNSYDLIITDLMMPEMDGMEFVGQIRKRLRLTEVYIIMLSARSDPEAKEESLAVGANEYVVKPIDDDELSIKVKLGVEHTREKREKAERRM